MTKCKLVSTPLASQFKLSTETSPKPKQEKEQTARLPYASVVGNLIYTIECTRPNISHTVGMVSMYMENLDQVHDEALKWILRCLKGALDVLPMASNLPKYA